MAEKLVFTAVDINTPQVRSVDIPRAYGHGVQVNSPGPIREEITLTVTGDE